MGDLEHEKALAQKWSDWAAAKIIEIFNRILDLNGRATRKFTAPNAAFQITAETWEGTSRLDIHFGQHYYRLTDLITEINKEHWTLLPTIRKMVIEYIQVDGPKEIARAEEARKELEIERKLSRENALKGFSEDLKEPGLTGEI